MVGIARNRVIFGRRFHTLVLRTLSPAGSGITLWKEGGQQGYSPRLIKNLYFPTLQNGVVRI